MNSAPTRTNPFPGLRPFAQEEDYLFFGREEQTLELLERLASHRFLAVVGTSGSGKSSLVRCGLLSELLGGRMLDAGASWEIAVTHPGGNPLTLLTDALLAADLYNREVENARENLLATLSRSHFGLVEAVKQADLGQRTNFLLVVDQFEEIFRFHEAGERQQEAANEFVSLLLEAATQKEMPIYIVLTMRSDFIGECGHFEGLAEMVNRGEFLIPRLTREQYKRVIEGPIKVAGGQITPRLLQRLLNDLGQQADQLPCLQHALMRTWDVWASRGDALALDLDDYQRVGKMSQALSLHADEIYESLATDRQRELCEGVFQALTVEEPNSRGIRRPQRLGRLCQILDVPADELQPVIDAYRQKGVTFLMPSPDVPLSSQTIIDISHESLMRVWARLRQWVEEETQAAGIYRRLSESASLHERGKAGLYRDPELGIALAWRDAKRPNSAWADRYRQGFDTSMKFLEASQKATLAEERSREAGREREREQSRRLAEAQELRIAQQLRSTRRLRAMLVGLGAVAAIAVGTSVVAGKLWYAADAAKRSAEKAEIEVTAQKNRAEEALLNAVDQTYIATGNEIRSMRLAHESGWRRAALERIHGLVELGSRKLDRVELRTEALACLAELDIRTESEIAPHDLAAWHLKYSPDGRSIAVNDAINRRVFVRDLSNNRELLSVPKLTGLTQFAFHPAGALVVPDAPGRVTYHATNKDQPTFPTIQGEGATLNLAFSESGERVAVAWGDIEPVHGATRQPKCVTIYETATGAPIRTIAFPAGSFGGYKIPLALSPDGRSVALSGPGLEVRLHSVDQNTEPVVLGRLDLRICALAFQPGGRFLAAAGSRTAAIWDLADRSELVRFHAPEEGFWDIAFSPDGQLLAGATNDGRARLWDCRSGREIAVVHPQAAAGLSIAFSPRGDHVAIGGASVSILAIEGRLERRTETSQTNHVNDLVFDPLRDQLFHCGGNGRIYAWKLDHGVGQIIKQTSGNKNDSALQISPDGCELLLGQSAFINTSPSPDYSILAWSPDDPTAERRFEGPREGIASIGVDPMGRGLAAGTLAGELFVWDFDSSQLSHRQKFAGGVSCLSFVDDSRLLVAAGDRLVLLSTLDFRVIAEQNFAGPAGFVVLPGDREAIVITTAGTIDRVRLTDLEAVQSRKAFPPSSSLCLALSPNGSLLAVTIDDGTRVALLDPRTLKPLARLPDVERLIASAAFDAKGDRLALSGSKVILWDIARVRDELAKIGLDLGAFDASAGESTDLIKKFTTVMSGQNQPADNGERLSFARIADDQKQFAAAARLWFEAFASNPRLVRERPSQYRLNAAFAAARAACGQAKGELPLEEAAKAKLRRNALDGFRAELTARSQLVDSKTPETAATAVRQMTRWRQEKSLAGLRDADSLASLPEPERDQWRRFWSDVDEVIARIGPGAMERIRRRSSLRS